MIRYNLSQRNVWPYLIGLSLIAAVVLASWLVIRNLPTINPPSNVGLSVEAPSSTAVHPADRKFFDTGHMALLMGKGVIGVWANVNPADRKFYTNEYAISSGESSAVDPLSNVNPADRKFYTNEYAIGIGESTGFDSLANVDPADRKFFTNGYAAGGISGEVDSLANVHPADRKFFANGGYGSSTP